MKARVIVAGLVVVVASLVTATSAFAVGETAVVTTNTDNGSAGCELRDAVTAVTTNTSPVGGCTTVDGSGTDDHVNFAAGVTGQTITLTGSQIIINDTESDLDITGPGMNQLTVSGDDASRVFLVMTPTSISGMSLVHGLAPVSTGQALGGAIESTAHGAFSLVLTDVKVADSAAEATASTGTAFADGGAIHAVNGRLVLDQSIVTANHATATQTGGLALAAEARGGAIFNQDDITITDSTISGNNATATTNGTGQAAATGGIRSDGTLEMSGSTMSGNVAIAAGTSGPARARGALLQTGGSINDVEQSTIAANKADATSLGALVRAGGLDLVADTNIRSSTIALNGPDTATDVDGANITIEGGTSEIENTIIAGPRGGGMNCANTLTSDGFNDDSSPAGASCLDTPLMSDLTSDPLLAAAGLAPNGGLTQTIALQPTSPVIDQGTNADLTDPGQDQRGAAFTRPVDFSGLPNADNGTDIGAFEVQQACSGLPQPTPSAACPGPPSPPPPGPSGQTGQRAAALKKCKKLKGKKASKRKKCIKRAKKLPV